LIIEDGDDSVVHICGCCFDYTFNCNVSDKICEVIRLAFYIWTPSAMSAGRKYCNLPGNLPGAAAPEPNASELMSPEGQANWLVHEIAHLP